jgi:adenylosuccinate lyase
MLERYSREEMLKVWTDESMYKFWLDIEIAVCEAYGDLGKIPTKVVERIREKADFDIERIKELEKQTQHDMLAFLSCVAEYVDNDDSRFIHLGLTSSDVKDTALSMQMKKSGVILDSCINELLVALKEMAIEHKDTVCIGRSHGVHAEPTTFGLKILNFHDDVRRCKEHVVRTIDEVSVGMFSGAVGTFANLDPEIEKLTCEKLGLRPAVITTQVISRDRHASFVNSLAVLAGVLERIAIEIRHLQRTEVLEVEEPFYKNQKGSSAMPHKRNPWRSENISGLARLVRGYASSTLENIALWHERDISHSSVERVALPDACILVDFMTNRITQIIRGLRVYPDNMQENLYKFGGVVFSQQVLIKLVYKGFKREEAYNLVQKLAHEAWNTKTGDFKKLLHNSEEITEFLTKEEINECFEPEYHLKNIDHIYHQCFPELKKKKSEAVEVIES